MEDAQIIELFFARSEDAISELDKKYGKLCHKLADNILASAQDAESSSAVSVNKKIGQHPCKRAGCGGVRERCLFEHLERDPAAASGIASGVCRHARPPLFDHALSCQHGNETKQPLRYVHGGA